MQPLLRPTFEIVVNEPPESVLSRLSTLEGGPAGLRLRKTGAHLCYFYPKDARHAWSPWLHVDVREAESGGASVFGRFSPNPNLWTAYMLSYLGLSTTAILALGFGFSLWAVGRPAGIVWVAPVCAAIAIVMLWASKVGQGLAREQMHELHDAIRAAASA